MKYLAQSEQHKQVLTNEIIKAGWKAQNPQRRAPARGIKTKSFLLQGNRANHSATEY